VLGKTSGGSNKSYSSHDDHAKEVERLKKALDADSQLTDSLRELLK
jgi:hypothetical protein